MIVGVLAFQGDVMEHIDVLHRLHVPSLEVRSCEDLTKADALIIPGGESTVIAGFLQSSGVGRDIVQRVRSRTHPLTVFGTCAGAIVLAKAVTGKNAPKGLGLIDITIERNAYGTQAESFETTLKVSGLRERVPAAFIRAPKITRFGKGVEVLARYRGQPVLVRQGSVTVATFHAEVRDDTRLHARIFTEGLPR